MDRNLDSGFKCKEANATGLVQQRNGTKRTAIQKEWLDTHSILYVKKRFNVSSEINIIGMKNDIQYNSNKK